MAILHKFLTFGGIIKSVGQELDGKKQLEDVVRLVFSGESGGFAG
jgi:hypothetical protein